MGKGSQIERPTIDQGSIDMLTDFDTGMITVTIREPLSITKHAVKVSIPDFLEKAAMIQIETIKIGRAQAAAFAQKATEGRQA